MSQLPGGPAPLRPETTADSSAPQDAAGTEETLPSGSDSSGLSPAVRQQLEAQVQAAGGSVDQIASGLRAHIDEIDNRGLPEEGPLHQQLQADRALYVAQLSYLEDHLASGATSGRRAARGELFDTATSGRDDRASAATNVAGVEARERAAASGADSATTAGRSRRVRVYDTRR